MKRVIVHRLVQGIAVCDGRTAEDYQEGNEAYMLDRSWDTFTEKNAGMGGVGKRCEGCKRPEEID